MLYNYNRLLNLTKILIAILLIIGFSSCDKFDGNQTVPAYVHIDKITLLDNGNNMGSLSSSITDAWFYVDDQYIGTFELPATFPVLLKGSHTIKVLAGIKMNGITNTRVAYPFYNTIILTKTFSENETMNLGTLTTQYDPNTKMEWIENFEDGGISLQKSTVNAGSDTNIIKTNQAGYVFEGLYSGVVALDSNMNFFEIETIQKYKLPRGSSPVFLEMDYKINNTVNVGLDAYTSGTPTQISTMVLLPTTQWKKIYINFTPDISNNATADNFRVFFGQFKNTGVTKATLLFDNIKLVHFNTSKKK